MVLSFQLSVISFQLSVISFQVSVISCLCLDSTFVTFIFKFI